MTDVEIQVDDLDNKVYTQILNHFSQILDVNSVEQWRFDSGVWNVQAGATPLAAIDFDYLTLANTPTPPLFSHVAFLFALKYPTGTDIYDAMTLNFNLLTTVVGVPTDFEMGVHIMNLVTGEWEKIGNNIIYSPTVQDIEIFFEKNENLAVNYVYADYIYILVANHECSSTDTASFTVDFDYALFTLRQTDDQTIRGYIASIKSKIRAITGYHSEEVISDETLNILIDVAFTDVATRIDGNPDLLNEYHVKAALYMGCYLAMISVNGPGIKSYRMDKNYGTLGDPYAQTRGSWFLQQYEDAVRKSSAIILKSTYDLRTYEPLPYPIQDMKQEPQTYDYPTIHNE